MSFEEECSKCGTHMYAFADDAKENGGPYGWVLDGDNALCVGCAAEKLERLSATIAALEAERAELKAECERLREYRERGMPPDYEIDMSKLRATLARTKDSRERQKARAEAAEAMVDGVRELVGESCDACESDPDSDPYACDGCLIVHFRDALAAAPATDAPTCDIDAVRRTLSKTIPCIDDTEAPATDAQRCEPIYHPDPEINAEVLADKADAQAFDRAAGIVDGWHRGYDPADEAAELRAENDRLRNDAPRCETCERVREWAKPVDVDWTSHLHTEAHDAYAEAQCEVRAIIDAGREGAADGGTDG